MEIPKFRDSRQNEANCCEISVPPPQPHNLSWAITLSLFMPFASQDNEILKRLKYFKIDDSSANKIKQCVKTYNPFQNRYRCFHDEEMNTFVDSLTERLKFYIASSEFNSIHKELKGKINSKFQAAADLLNCNITVITEIFHSQFDEKPYGETTEKTFHSCHVNTQTEILTESSSVTLYCKQFPRNKCKFSFGIAEEIGLSLQKRAFNIILRNAGILQMEILSEELFSLEGLKDNFIVCLTKNGKTGILKRLLTQPAYIMDNINEAGFVVSPLKKEYATLNEFQFQPTAFYYAIEKSDIKLLYLLYSYAINPAPWTEYSTREPNSAVLDNLMLVRSVLRETEAIFLQMTSTSTLENEMFICSKELTNFHDFQFEVSQKMLKIDQRINYVECVPEQIYQANKLKETVLEILNAYSRHFHMFDGVACDQQNFLFGPNDNFIRYKNYFHNLDFNAVLLFFDHSFSLKNRVKFDDGQMETSFVRFVFLCEYYYFMLNEIGFGQRQRSFSQPSQTSPLFRKVSYGSSAKFPLGGFQSFGKKNDTFFILTHLERTNFKQLLDEYRNSLLSFTVSEENVRPCLPKSEVYTLKTEPEIKGEFMSRHLKHYLDLCNSVNVEEDFETSKFVIQRTLQVIGEFVKVEPDDSLTVIKSLIVSAFPEFVSKDLSKIRNMLCHNNSKRKRIHARMEIEKDKSFFKQLQSELKQITNSIGYVFELQSLLIKRHVLQNAINIIESYLEHLEVEKINYAQGKIEFDTNISNLADDRNVKNVENQSYSTSSVYNSPNDAAGKSYSERYLSGDDKREHETVLNRCYGLLFLRFQNAKKKLKKKSSTHRSVYEKHFINIFSRIDILFEEIKGEKEKDKKRSKKSESYTENSTKEEKEEKISYLFKCAKSLLEFVVFNSTYSNMNNNRLLRKIKEVPDYISGSKDSVEFLLKEYKALKSDVFRKVNFLDSKTNMVSDLECIAIHKLRRIFQGQHFFSKASKERILSSANDKFKKHHDVMVKLMHSLEEGNILGEEELDAEIRNLGNSKKQRKVREYYKNCDLDGLKGLSDYYSILQEGLEKNELNKLDYDYICDHFGYSDDIKAELRKIVSGLPQILEDKSLEFFKLRIEKMKELLITKNKYIDHLWHNAKSTKAKYYTRDRLVRIYLKQPALQAAIELLLFDCMHLMKEKKNDLVYLWQKTKYLFNGINVRNILAHGNPLFEAVCEIMDPYDLPNEIISKVLELVNDLETIEAMCELKTKTQGDFGVLTNLVKSEPSNIDEKYRDLCSKISKCKNWEDYAYLIKIN